MQGGILSYSCFHIVLVCPRGGGGGSMFLGGAPAYSQPSLDPDGLRNYLIPHLFGMKFEYILCCSPKTAVPEAPKGDNSHP